jgi:predicted amidophosphoribosyltransferase
MDAFAELIDLVLPSGCLCCERPGAFWCGSCQPASEPAAVGPATGPPCYAAGEYAEELRTALIAYKERGRRQLAEPLAGYLADAVDCAMRSAGGPARPVLVPVPSSRRAARARGGDHVLRLARLVARQAELPLLATLRLAGPVRDSAGLSAGQRRQNLAGRMVAGSPPGGAGFRPPPGGLGFRPILLDDIVTTGATLAEAGRALTAAGWPPATAAVVAATRLRRAAAAGSRDRDPPSVATPRAPGGGPANSPLPQLGRLAIRG